MKATEIVKEMKKSWEMYHVGLITLDEMNRQNDELFLPYQLKLFAEMCLFKAVKFWIEDKVKEEGVG